jgi:hypothetical protein
LVILASLGVAFSLVGGVYVAQLASTVLTLRTPGSFHHFLRVKKTLKALAVVLGLALLFYEPPTPDEVQAFNSIQGLPPASRAGWSQVKELLRTGRSVEIVHENEFSRHEGSKHHVCEVTLLEGLGAEPSSFLEYGWSTVQILNPFPFNPLLSQPWAPNRDLLERDFGAWVQAPGSAPNGEDRCLVRSDDEFEPSRCTEQANTREAGYMYANSGCLFGRLLRSSAENVWFGGFLYRPLPTPTLQDFVCYVNAHNDLFEEFGANLEGNLKAVASHWYVHGFDENRNLYCDLGAAPSDEERF